MLVLQIILVRVADKIFVRIVDHICQNCRSYLPELLTTIVRISDGYIFRPGVVGRVRSATGDLEEL